MSKVLLGLNRGHHAAAATATASPINLTDMRAKVINDNYKKHVDGQCEFCNYVPDSNVPDSDVSDSDMTESTTNIDFDRPQPCSRLAWSAKTVCTDNARVTVHMHNLESSLVEYIKKAHTIVGCVAWLTNTAVLTELAHHEVSIVVQAEDWLRPDSISLNSSWPAHLRSLYAKVPDFNYKNYYTFHPLLHDTIFTVFNDYLDVSIPAFRCAGELNRHSNPAFPRMHHKFLVFADKSGVPYAVWTGSFNITLNGTHSLENAVYIESQEVARAYIKEWAHVLIMSDNLEWAHKWTPTSQCDFYEGT